MARERSASADEDAARRAAAFNALNRNKRSIALNLKDKAAQKVLRRTCQGRGRVRGGIQAGRRLAAGLRLPDPSAPLNPRLVYCSLSGYGQDGPYSGLVGHDINYISVGGALGVIGEKGGAPVIPYNIIADFAGGGLHAATAILAAVIARGHTGRGQYVDVAMSDGVAYMLASLMSAYFSDGVVAAPGAMSLNGAAPYYNVYQCRDGRYISVGCIEPWFWAALCRALGREDLIPIQFDDDQAEYIKSELRDIFITRDRDEWWETLSAIDNIAVARVSSLDEVAADRQNLPPQHDNRSGRRKRTDSKTSWNRPPSCRTPPAKSASRGRPPASIRTKFWQNWATRRKT